MTDNLKQLIKKKKLILTPTKDYFGNILEPGDMVIVAQHSNFTSGIIEQEKLMSKPAPIINKIDITTGENGSEDESGVSGDDWAGHNSDKSESEFEEENAVETYDNDLDQEGFDVEDAGAIWENE